MVTRDPPSPGLEFISYKVNSKYKYIKYTNRFYISLVYEELAEID